VDHQRETIRDFGGEWNDGELRIASIGAKPDRVTEAGLQSVRAIGNELWDEVPDALAFEAVGYVEGFRGVAENWAVG